MRLDCLEAGIALVSCAADCLGGQHLGSSLVLFVTFYFTAYFMVLFSNRFHTEEFGYNGGSRQPSCESPASRLATVLTFRPLLSRLAVFTHGLFGPYERSFAGL